jgi:hypothetical protein
MEYCRKESILSEDTPSTIIYFVTIDELTDAASGVELETYGVGITICQRNETVYIPNVTFSKTAVLKLSELLAENLVTPATIGDVVEDWLCA